jgi:hypothetical protein
MLQLCLTSVYGITIHSCGSTSVEGAALHPRQTTRLLLQRHISLTIADLP